MKKILWVCREDGLGRSSEFLTADSEVSTVRTFDEALMRLRDGRYDLVAFEQGEELASGRASMAEQTSVLLENVGQGIGILDLQGQILWGNRHLTGQPADVRDGLRDRCLELFADEIASGHAQAISRRFTLQGHGHYFEVTASPVIDGHDRITQVAVVMWDATRSRQLQQKIDAIDHAGRELVRLEGGRLDELSIPDRLALLEEKIINATQEILGFDKFCIRLLDKKTNRLELVSSSGLTSRAKKVDLFASAEGNGISGYVAATGRSYICPDVERDARYVEGIGSAGSTLTVPLSLQDQVVGVFNIESEEKNAFTEDDRQFAEIFARYVAIALHILDLLVVERFQVSGQLAKNVTTEISSPLNDILTDATSLMEEYIGRDDLRAKLQAIIANVGRIRDVVKDVTAEPNGLLDHRNIEKVEKDPLLDGRAILVVDDEPIIRETINDVLGNTGAEIELASDGAEAIAKIEQREYELILTDIKMPKKNGYDIFEAAKRRNPDVPIVFMTGFGYDPNHSIIRARQEGLAGVLYKPFKVSDLVNLIRDVMKEKASSQEVK